MNFNIFNSFILSGIIQGFVFVIVVLSSKKFKAKSTLFLLGLILAYSLGNLQFLLPDIGFMLNTKMYNYIYLPWASLIPVLLYFYCVLFLYPTKTITLKEKLLFLPFFIFLVLTIIFRIGVIFDYKNDIFYEFFGYIVNLHEILAIIFSVFILLVLIRMVFVYEKHHKEFKINSIQGNLNWLKIILAILFLLTVVWAYLMFRSLYQSESITSFYPLWVGIAFVIYLLGHIGIYKFGIISERKKIRKYNSEINKRSVNLQFKNVHLIAFENLLLNEKAYLDSQLTLEIVAEQLNLSSSYLSRIINYELNTSFTNYLNLHRIEEAKSYLINPEFSNYTIIAIGLEAGFNSKSSFFHVFKKATGKTPLAYKKEKQSA